MRCHLLHLVVVVQDDDWRHWHRSGRGALDDRAVRCTPITLPGVVGGYLLYRPEQNVNGKHPLTWYSIELMHALLLLHRCLGQDCVCSVDQPVDVGELDGNLHVVDKPLVVAVHALKDHGLPARTGGEWIGWIGHARWWSEGERWQWLSEGDEEWCCGSVLKETKRDGSGGVKERLEWWSYEKCELWSATVVKG